MKGAFPMTVQNCTYLSGQALTQCSFQLSDAKPRAKRINEIDL